MPRLDDSTRPSKWDGETTPEQEFKIWLRAEMRRMISIAMDYEVHDLLWGVPCGPTLTMVYPVQVLGFDEIMELWEAHNERLH